VQTDTHFYYHSLFVQGGTLYRGVIYFDTDNARPTYARIGSGWTSFTQLVTSNYAITAPNRSYLYGLSTNGSLRDEQVRRLGDGCHVLWPGHRRHHPGHWHLPDHRPLEPARERVSFQQ
jgi:hypothetical protein